MYTIIDVFQLLLLFNVITQNNCDYGQCYLITHNENSGEILSPNWPGRYWSNLNIQCTYHINTGHDMHIPIIIPEYNLANAERKENGRCRYDKLVVDISDSIIHDFCGYNKSMKPIWSSRQSFIIKFSKRIKQS